ncbi:hypothetical protein [Lacticaseibacillus rhamnosus]|uniref:hypothetical protein n=1 Tax=Lacticaseibacillus rhamnosus TaxID=47715 RepID=UPI0023E30914|nr:hypothetical protein [Lacticaseibacillus rhamnosus]MDF3335694.1 hypothetical protein [Lacticaseibacillus rhamnosus]
MITIQKSKQISMLPRTTEIVVNGNPIGHITDGFALKLDLHAGDKLQVRQGLLSRSKPLIISSTNGRFNIVPNPRLVLTFYLMIAAILVGPLLLAPLIHWPQNMIAGIIFVLFFLFELILGYFAGLELKPMLIHTN